MLRERGAKCAQTDCRPGKSRMLRTVILAAKSSSNWRASGISVSSSPQYHHHRAALAHCRISAPRRQTSGMTCSIGLVSADDGSGKFTAGMPNGEVSASVLRRAMRRHRDFNEHRGRAQPSSSCAESGCNIASRSYGASISLQVQNSHRRVGKRR